MKQFQKERFMTAAKKLSTMSAAEFVQWFPSHWVSRINAAVLILIALLPVLLSLLFQEPMEASAMIDAYSADLVNLYAFSSFWYQTLLFLGFPLGLMTALVCAKNRDQKKSLRCIQMDRIKTSLLPIGLLLMLVWSIPSALLSNNLKLCFLGDGYRHEGVLTYCVYALVFAGALQVSEKHMRWVAEVLCATCAFTGILVITAGQIFPGLFYLNSVLQAAMFHNSNHYGYYLAICFPICFGLILEESNPNIFRRIVRLAEFWLICNAIAFSNCRGSFLANVAAVIGWNICVFVQHKQKWKKCLVLDLLFVLTILVLHTESGLMSRMYTMIMELLQIQQAQSIEDLNTMGSNRGLYWRYGIQFALERPLFGYGPDNLGYKYTEIRSGLLDRPHNELIQFAASLGFPALIFYVTAIGNHVAAFFRCFRKLNLFHLALFASVGSYLVSSMFGNTMYYTTVYYIMILAFTYRICNPVNTEENSSP